MGRRQKPKPQQLDVLKAREAAAADAGRRYCPDLRCAIELRPWEKQHAGLHWCAPLDVWNADKRRLSGILSPPGPWMWGRVDVGDRFRLGDLAEVRDAALGRIIFTHCRPDDIDVYERTIAALQAGRSVVGA